MKKKLLINVVETEESRIAILEDGVLEELYIERFSRELIAGNIYKGRVVNVEPSIEAAFVDLGLKKNGFLHASDVRYSHDNENQLDSSNDSVSDNSNSNVNDNGNENNSDSVNENGNGHENNSDNVNENVNGHESSSDNVNENGNGHENSSDNANESSNGNGIGKRNDKRKRNRNARNHTKEPKPRIKTLLQPDQEVLVQVIKEGIGDKGPSITTHISLPGRFLVLMPGTDRLGVSRKIFDEPERKRLKEIIEDLNVPPHLGLIVRTAGENQTKR